MSLKESFDAAEKEFLAVHLERLHQARSGGHLYTYRYMEMALRKAARKHSLFDEALSAYYQTLHDL
jgi:hypothetical protein